MYNVYIDYITYVLITINLNYPYSVDWIQGWISGYHRRAVNSKEGKQLHDHQPLQSSTMEDIVRRGRTTLF